MIKAIETTYKGYRFRSRLEARWAVFFDHLGIKWQYEPEGFELNDGTLRYLPDFWLPDIGMWVEVKSTAELTDIEEQKAMALSYESQGPVYVTHGQPGDLGVLWYTYIQGGGEVNMVFCPAVPDWNSFARGAVKQLRIWVPIQDTDCEGHYSGRNFYFKESSLGLGEDEEDAQHLWSFCGDAVAAARGARFEFGESGALQ